MTTAATAMVDAWRERVAKELGEAPIESLNRRTPDGLTLEPLYAASDLSEGATRRPGAAGSPRLCPVLDTPDPRRAAAQARQDVEGGAGGFWLRLGVDALGAEALPAQAGEAGLALHHGADVSALLEGLDLTDRELWVDPGADALPWAALYLASRRRESGNGSGGVVHFGADPLGALGRDGKLPRDLMKLSSECAALTRYVAGNMPGSTALTISTAAYQEAGADRVLELAIMVATLWESLRMLGESGLSADVVAPMASLRFAVGTRIFPEIAKLRAAHLLWRATLGAAGVSDPPPARLHAVGSRRPLTVTEPSLNVLRATEQIFVATCGGADAVSVWGFDSFDDGVSGPLARRLARNTGLVLEHEGRLGRVADPAAGSFYVEALTRRLCEEAWKLAQEIDAEGGLRRALVSGSLAERIEAAAELRAEAFASGEAAITGVTHYVDETVRRIDESAAPKDDGGPQIDGDPQIDGGPVDAPEERRRAWDDGSSESPEYSRDFVVEELVAAALAGETVGELGSRLGDAEGSERCTALTLRRDAAPFEEGRG